MQFENIHLIYWNLEKKYCYESIRKSIIPLNGIQTRQGTLDFTMQYNIAVVVALGSNCKSPKSVSNTNREILMSIVIPQIFYFIMTLSANIMILKKQ